MPSQTVRSRRVRRKRQTDMAAEGFRCEDCEWTEDDAMDDPEAAARYHARSRRHMVSYDYWGSGSFNYREREA
jgi:hypothetical protein